MYREDTCQLPSSEDGVGFEREEGRVLAVSMMIFFQTYKSSETRMKNIKIVSSGRYIHRCLSYNLQCLVC